MRGTEDFYATLPEGQVGIVDNAGTRPGIESGRHHHDKGGGAGTGRDRSARKKKEPHSVWLFDQISESAQGRPAGLVATLLAAVLPP